MYLHHQARSQVWIRGSAFLAKVDLFTCFLGDSGIFCTYFGKKWTFLRAFLEKVDLFCMSPHVAGTLSGKFLKNMK